MRLLLPLDSRPANRAALGILDADSGKWERFDVLPGDGRFKRQGFRGAHLDGEALFVVGSAALYRLNIARNREPEITLLTARPEWSLGERAAADLHDVYWSRSRERLFVANSFMDAVDELSREGKLVQRHYLWDLSDKIAELANERRSDATDLVHVNHIEECDGELLLTLGNCNATRLGQVISFDSGETLLADLPFPHDGIFAGDRYYLSLSGSSELAVYEAANPRGLATAPVTRIPIEIRQEGWKDSFQWVRGICVSEHHVICGVTQWRNNSATAQIPPRLVVLDRHSLEVVGDLFLPEVEDFPSPAIFTVMLLDGAAARLDGSTWTDPPSPDFVARTAVREIATESWEVPPGPGRERHVSEPDLVIALDNAEPFYIRSPRGGFADLPRPSALSFAELARRPSLGLDCTVPPTMVVRLWIIYYDERERLAHQVETVDGGRQTIALRPPDGARACRLALRLSGSGTLTVRPIELLANR